MVIGTLFFLMSAFLPHAAIAQSHVHEPSEHRFSGKTYQEVQADPEIQRMAFDMGNADCNDLLSLPDEIKELFLLAVMYLQRPNTLSHINGLECAMFGESDEIAAIEDPSLTINEERESLYYLPEMHTLLVTHKKTDSIAYGISVPSEVTDPVQYFTDNRVEAEKSATFARVFSKVALQSAPPNFEAKVDVAVNGSSGESAESGKNVGEDGEMENGKWIVDNEEEEEEDVAESGEKTEEKVGEDGEMENGKWIVDNEEEEEEDVAESGEKAERKVGEDGKVGEVGEEEARRFGPDAPIVSPKESSPILGIVVGASVFIVIVGAIYIVRKRKR